MEWIARTTIVLAAEININTWKEWAILFISFIYQFCFSSSAGTEISGHVRQLLTD